MVIRHCVKELLAKNSVRPLLYLRAVSLPTPKYSFFNLYLRFYRGSTAAVEGSFQSLDGCRSSWMYFGVPTFWESGMSKKKRKDVGALILCYAIISQRAFFIQCFNIIECILIFFFNTTECQ